MESARFPSPSQRDAVIAALGSSDPLLRLGGIHASSGLDAKERLSRFEPLLGDPVKDVRMAMAQQLIDLSIPEAPPPLQSALMTLMGEYERSLLHNADMPESMSDLGLLYESRGDFDGAEKALLHARKLAPRYVPAMLNLSDVYRAKNRDDLGEQVLREAMAADPESADVHHVLGLLYVRTGRTADSVALFEHASRLAPQDAQYALVHGMALVETGRRAEGIRVLQAASQRFRDNAQIRQVLESYGRP